MTSSLTSPDEQGFDPEQRAEAVPSLGSAMQAD